MQDELLVVGIDAYKSHLYDDAINVLEQTDSDNWLGQLYLAMSYAMVNRLDDAQRVFYRIKSECLDADLRDKAQNAFMALRLQLRERAERQRKEAEDEEIEI